MVRFVLYCVIMSKKLITISEDELKKLVDRTVTERLAEMPVRRNRRVAVGSYTPPEIKDPIERALRYKALTIEQIVAESDLPYEKVLKTVAVDYAKAGKTQPLIDFGKGSLWIWRFDPELPVSELFAWLEAVLKATTGRWTNFDELKVATRSSTADLHTALNRLAYHSIIEARTIEGMKQKKEYRWVPEVKRPKISPLREARMRRLAEEKRGKR